MTNDTKPRDYYAELQQCSTVEEVKALAEEFEVEVGGALRKVNELRDEAEKLNDQANAIEREYNRYAFTPFSRNAAVRAGELVLGMKDGQL